MKYNKLFFLGLMLALFLVMGVAAAHENSTADQISGEVVSIDEVPTENDDISDDGSITKKYVVFNVSSTGVIKSDETIKLMDLDGEPVRNATVEVYKNYFFQYNKTTNDLGVFDFTPENGTYKFQFNGNEQYYSCFTVFTGVEENPNEGKELVTITSSSGSDVAKVYYGDSEWFYVEDEWASMLYDMKLIFKWDDNTTDIIYTDIYDEDDYDFNYAEYYFWQKPGTYAVTVSLEDKDYYAKPLSIKFIVEKAPVSLSLNKPITTTKEYVILKATVKDAWGDYIYEGKVTFKINGKSYTVKVKEGVATKKIKLTKVKTYTYKATFSGGDYYKSKTVSGKVYVKKAKKYYTFTAKKWKSFKSTSKLTYKLPYKYYVKLLNAKNNGKSCYLGFKTKIKVLGYKWFKTTCGFDLTKKGKLTFCFYVDGANYATIASKYYDLYKSI